MLATVCDFNRPYGWTGVGECIAGETVVGRDGSEVEGDGVADGGDDSGAGKESGAEAEAIRLSRSISPPPLKSVGPLRRIDS